MSASELNLILKGMTLQDIFDDVKQTLGASAPAYSTVTKWHAEFKWGRSTSEDTSHCETTVSFCQ